MGVDIGFKCVAFVYQQASGTEMLQRNFSVLVCLFVFFFPFMCR